MSVNSTAEIAQIWEEELMNAGKAIVASSVTGMKLQTEPVEVSIDVPVVILKAFKNACWRLGLDETMVTQMVSGMASSGFTRALEEKLGLDKPGKVAPQQQAPDVPQNQHMDMNQLMGQLGSAETNLSGLTNKLSEIKSMMDQLGGMGEIFKNAGSDKSNTEDISNCIKPSVPTR
jgi:hypothetical protein